MHTPASSVRLPRLCRLALLAIVLLVAGACGVEAHYYWIKGLNIPQGSTDVLRSVLDDPLMGLPPRLPAGSFSRVLSVSFNHKDGWQKVQDSISSDLASAGYTKLAPVDGAAENALALGGRDPAELICIYDKADQRYAVWLVNIGATMEDAHMHREDEGLQDFTLFVGRLK